MANIPMTRERYNALVSAFVQVGRPVFLQVAKIAGMDRQTAKKGWEVGFLRYGAWAEPIRNKFPLGFVEGVKDAQEGERITETEAPTQNQHATNHTLPEIKGVPEARKGATEEMAAAGAQPAYVAERPTSPAPSYDAYGQDDADGLTDKQRVILGKEDDNLLASMNVMSGLHWMTQKALASMKDKMGPMMESIGKIGDDKDPYAAKHAIEALVQLTNASTRNAETMLRVMEATRLKIGQPQKITDTRTTPEAPSAGEIARARASLEHMAQIAANVGLGKKVRDTHYIEPVDVEVVPALTDEAAQ